MYVAERHLVKLWHLHSPPDSIVCRNQGVEAILGQYTIPWKWENIMPFHFNLWRVNTCAYVRVYIHVCTHVCMYVYTYVRTYTQGCKWSIDLVTSHIHMHFINSPHVARTAWSKVRNTNIYRLLAPYAPCTQQRTYIHYCYDVSTYPDDINQRLSHSVTSHTRPSFLALTEAMSTAFSAGLYIRQCADCRDELLFLRWWGGGKDDRVEKWRGHS